MNTNKFFKGIIFHLIVASLFLLSNCNSSPSSKISEKIIQFDPISDPTKESLVIINNDSKKLAKFSLFMNGKMTNSLSTICQEISETSKETKQPIYEVAWEWVCDHSTNSDVIFNSPNNTNYIDYLVGVGKSDCLIESKLLCEIWNTLGLQSRTWHLEGHVLPEVLVDDKWQIYDPLSKIQWTDSNNEILSVAQIEHNPTLLYEQSKNISIEHPYSSFIPTEYFKKCFSSLENNKVEYFTSKIQSEDFTFSLPPNSILKFNLLSENFPDIPTDLSDIANVEITLREDWNNSIEIDLPISSIKGSFSANMKRSLIKVKKGNHIAKQGDLLSDYKFIHLKKGTKIKLKINPSFYILKKDNSIIINGQNIDNLEASIIESSDSIVNKRVVFYSKINRIRQKLTCAMNDTSFLSKKTRSLNTNAFWIEAEEVIENHNCFNQQEAKSANDRTFTKFKNSVLNLPDSVQYNMIDICSNSFSLSYIYFLYIENLIEINP